MRKNLLVHVKDTAVLIMEVARRCLLLQSNKS